jgi:hypothetical protein
LLATQTGGNVAVDLYECTIKRHIEGAERVKVYASYQLVYLMSNLVSIISIFDDKIH